VARDHPVAQHAGLHLHLAHPVLDQVTDADHADEPAAVHHRQVPVAEPRHQRHGAGDGLVRAAGVHVVGHDRLDPLVQHRRAAPGEAAHDVALGDDPADPPVGVADHQRAHVGVGETAVGLGHRDPRQRRVDLDALLAQDVRDAHGAPLM